MNIKLFRITVDSKVPPELVRLAVCRATAGLLELADKKTKRIKITDRLNLWGQEEELVISRDNFRKEMADYELDLGKSGKFEWAKLEEGQVFLAGTFQAVKPARRKKSPGRPGGLNKKDYYFDPKAKFKIVRIDAQIKSGIRRLYFSTMRGTQKISKRASDRKGRG